MSDGQQWVNEGVRELGQVKGSRQMENKKGVVTNNTLLKMLAKKQDKPAQRTMSTGEILSLLDTPAKDAGEYVAKKEGSGPLKGNFNIMSNGSENKDKVH